MPAKKKKGSRKVVKNLSPKSLSSKNAKSVKGGGLTFKTNWKC